MFTCIQCSERFTLEDLKAGRYFISTSICLGCYKQMVRSKIRCFGKENKYNIQNITCQECPDERICRVAVKHKSDF